MGARRIRRGVPRPFPGAFWRRRSPGAARRDLKPQDILLSRHRLPLAMAELRRSGAPGSTSSKSQDLRLLLSLSEQDVIIEVESGIDAQTTLAALEARAAAINEAANREERLLKRMQEIVDRPFQASQLGLLRIACEGGFYREHSHNVSVLTVRATRKSHG